MAQDFTSGFLGIAWTNGFKSRPQVVIPNCPPPRAPLSMDCRLRSCGSLPLVDLILQSALLFAALLLQLRELFTAPPEMLHVLYFVRMCASFWISLRAPGSSGRTQRNPFASCLTRKSHVSKIWHLLKPQVEPYSVLLLPVATTHLLSQRVSFDHVVHVSFSVTAGVACSLFTSLACALAVPRPRRLCDRSVHHPLP